MSRRFTHEGRLKSIRQISIDTGSKYSTLYRRLVYEKLTLTEALKSRKNPKRTYTYKGQHFRSLSALARHTQMAYQTLRWRLVENDWELERALTTPVKVLDRKRTYEYLGKQCNSSDLAKRAKVTIFCMSARLHKGLTPEEAVNFIDSRIDARRRYTYKGVKYSCGELAKLVGIEPDVMSGRLHRRNTVKDAVEYKVLKQGRRFSYE